MNGRMLLAIALSLVVIPTVPTGATTRLLGDQNQPVLSKASVSTGRFSVTYPDHWLITSQSQNFVMIFNQQPLAGGGEAPPYMIKTDIGILPISLEGILEETGEGEQIPTEFGNVLISRRIETVVVAGQEVLRVWEEGGETFRNSVATYFPISPEETAYVISFYNVQNQAAEPVILQLHNSFELLR